MIFALLRQTRVFGHDANRYLQVQCLLLMAQYRQGTQRADQAWNLHGLAVRAAIQLGLHSPSASVGLSAIETEIRKRTWFGCMMMDRYDYGSVTRLLGTVSLTVPRILSMTFGRPPTIPNDYMKLDLPLNQNLDKLTVLGSTAASVGTLDPPDTVCFFIATMYANSDLTPPALDCLLIRPQTTLLHYRRRSYSIVRVKR